jgi:hypothetical protein
MSTLRSKVIRLAHANPSLRPHLLPLLKQAGTAQVWFSRGPGGLSTAVVQLGAKKFKVPFTSYRDGTLMPEVPVSTPGLERFLQNAWDAYADANAAPYGEDDAAADSALGYNRGPAPLKRNADPVNLMLPPSAYAALTDPQNRIRLAHLLPLLKSARSSFEFRLSMAMNHDMADAVRMDRDGELTESYVDLLRSSLNRVENSLDGERVKGSVLKVERIEATRGKLVVVLEASPPPVTEEDEEAVLYGAERLLERAIFEEFNQPGWDWLYEEMKQEIEFEVL